MLEAGFGRSPEGTHSCTAYHLCVPSRLTRTGRIHLASTPRIAHKSLKSSLCLALHTQGGSISSLLHRFGPLQESVIRIYTRQVLSGGGEARP